DARGQRDRQRERAGAGLHVAAAFGDRTFPLNVRMSFKRRHKAPFENGSGFWVLGSGFWFWVLGSGFWVQGPPEGGHYVHRLRLRTASAFAPAMAMAYIICACVR